MQEKYYLIKILEVQYNLTKNKKYRRLIEHLVNDSIEKNLEAKIAFDEISKEIDFQNLSFEEVKKLKSEEENNG